MHVVYAVWCIAASSQFMGMIDGSKEAQYMLICCSIRSLSYVFDEEEQKGCEGSGAVLI